MPALAHLPQHRASPLSKNPASGCWANLRRHTSLLARRQASTYTHVRLGLPTSLAPCLARNLTQHRAQIDPLPNARPRAGGLDRERRQGTASSSFHGGANAGLAYRASVGYHNGVLAVSSQLLEYAKKSCGRGVGEHYPYL